MLADPGPGADHHAVGLDVAVRRLHRGDAAVLHVVAVDRRAENAAHAPLHAFVVKTLHREVGAGIARRLFVQHDIGPLDVEVGPHGLEKLLGVLAGIDIRRIAGGVLALVHFLVVGFLVRLADRNVADLLEAEVRRVGLPDVDRVAQDGVERRGHVEIAHASAGDAGGAGAGPGLVEQHHVGALALAGLFQRHGEMPGGRHAVHAGADDDIGGRFGQ